MRSSTFFICIITCALFSCRLSADSGSNQASRLAAKSAETALQTSTPSEKRGFYNWLIKEMYEQVFLRAPSAKTDTAGWANVFAQGGSIEGVYHGLILSSEYSAMEKGRADLKSIRFFAQEMVRLENPKINLDEAKNKTLVDKFIKENLASSVFTMKRVLGEKLLSEIEKRKNDREALAIWYSETAVRWAKLDISFGMSQRSLQDLDFHKNWAKENSLGLIQWETLNRAHRILNFYNNLIISPAK